MGWCMQAAGLVDRIIREHADDILDSDKAVRRVEAERHSQLASARVRSLHSVTCPLHCDRLSRPTFIIIITFLSCQRSHFDIFQLHCYTSACRLGTDLMLVSTAAHAILRLSMAC